MQKLNQKIFIDFLSVIFSGVQLLKAMSLYKSVENLIVCPQRCGKIYKYISSLNKHLKYECNKVPQFKCLFCHKMTKRPDNWRTHMRLKHGYIPSTIQNPFEDIVVNN